MMRKSTLVLVIVISALMFYAGCGEDDDGGMMGEPPPGGPVPNGGGVPPMACENCPCDFYRMPMTEACWMGSNQPQEGPRFRTSVIEGVGVLCSLIDQNDDTNLAYEAPSTDCTGNCISRCFIGTFRTDSCANLPFVAFNINDASQLADCRTCLENYATDLNSAGIPVEGGPPYKCAEQP